jgi:HK97 family phage major capsid protein
MANPIIEKIEEIGTVVHEYQKTNDERIDQLAKGNEGRVRELEHKLDKMDSALDEAIKAKKDAERAIEEQKHRIEMLEALTDQPRGTPQEQFDAKYFDLFMKGLRSRFEDDDVKNELRDCVKKASGQKDIILGVNASGGFGLPKVIAQEIESLVLAQSEIVANVKNVQVGTSDYQELVSIFGGTSGWVSETGSRSATGTPNLRSQKPTWGELYAYPQISEWALQDLQFDAQGWLVGDIAEGMAKELSGVIWNGNGSNKPTGMTNTTPVTTADYASPMRAATAYQYVGLVGPSSPTRLNSDSIIDLVYTLNPRYRSNAKFGMNTVTQGTVRRLKDTTGQYLWQPSMQQGQPERLLGFEIFTWEEMNNPVNDGFCMGFGDFRRGYLLVSRTELAITPDQVTNPGYIRFYVRRRYGGIPLNNDAVKFLRVSD